MSDICANLHNIRRHIEKSALKAGRNPRDITLVAVTKTVPVEGIEEALQCGIMHIGENRVQEAQRKYPVIGDRACWHLIGHLQTNKVKHALPMFQLIHSVDRLGLAEEISRQAARRELPVRILVQVNIAGEDTKFGLDPAGTIDFVRHISQMPGLKIEGLMTIAPFVDDPEEVRPVFRALRLQAETIRGLKIPGVSMDILSMGMTGDYTVAIEEGATLIRIGTGIFGHRSYTEEGTK